MRLLRRGCWTGVGAEKHTDGAAMVRTTNAKAVDFRTQSLEKPVFNPTLAENGIASDSGIGERGRYERPAIPRFLAPNVAERPSKSS